MSPDEFRRQAHEAVEWVARYMERVEDLPVRAQVEPGEVRAALAAVTAGAPGGVVGDPGRPRPGGRARAPPTGSRPSFFAYFNGNTSGPAVIGDLVAAGLGVQGMLWSTGPACTEVETLVLDWLAELLGLPERFRSSGPRRRRRSRTARPGPTSARCWPPASGPGDVARHADLRRLHVERGALARSRRRPASPASGPISCGWSPVDPATRAMRPDAPAGLHRGGRGGRAASRSSCAPPSAPPPPTPSTRSTRSRTSPSRPGRGCTSTPPTPARQPSAPSSARSTGASSGRTATAWTRTSGCSPASTATRSGWPTARR